MFISFYLFNFLERRRETFLLPSLLLFLLISFTFMSYLQLFSVQRRKEGKSDGSYSFTNNTVSLSK